MMGGVGEGRCSGMGRLVQTGLRVGDRGLGRGATVRRLSLQPSEFLLGA